MDDWKKNLTEKQQATLNTTGGGLDYVKFMGWQNQLSAPDQYGNTQSLGQADWYTKALADAQKVGAPPPQQLGTGLTTPADANASTMASAAEQTKLQAQNAPILATGNNVGGIPTEGQGLVTPESMARDTARANAEQAKIQYDIAVQGSPYTSSEVDRQRYKTALTNLQATGQQAPTTLGQASSAVQGALPPAPPAPPNTTLINTTLQADTGLQSLMQTFQQYMSPQVQQQTLTQEYTKMLETSGLQGINTQLLNAKKVIEGTTDDIRSEITKAGGFATESQVQALSLARNKTLVQNYNNLLDQKNQIQDQVNTMIGLSEKDRTAATAQLDKQMNLSFKIVELQQTMQKNAQETYNNLVTNMGYNGLYNATGGDPYYTSLVENSLGLAPGGLQQLAAQQEYEKQVKENREAIKIDLQNQLAQAQISQAQAATEKSLAETAGIGTKQYLDTQKALADIQESDLKIKELEQKIAYAPTKQAQDTIKAQLDELKTKADIAYTKAQRVNIQSQIKERDTPQLGIPTITGKPQTTVQASANGYADRLNEANIVIDQLGSKFTSAVSWGGSMPNFLQSSDRQAYEQAKRNFVNAVLRRESGAAISATEFDSAEKQYFPQAGDKPNVVKQKEVSRNTAINNIYREANVVRPVKPGQIIESGGKRYKVGSDGQTLTEIK